MTILEDSLELLSWLERTATHTGLPYNPPMMAAMALLLVCSANKVKATLVAPNDSCKDLVLHFFAGKRHR